ncbi:hypothetical protein PR048_029260, partial [Dryococelus australis]
MYIVYREYVITFLFNDDCFLFSDSSLDDIKYVLNPTFTSEQIQMMDTSDKLSRAIDGTMYLPGIVGLNNIKANDYCNVILQASALSHVTPLRNYFLREINYARVKRPPGDSSFLLVQRFGELMRKLWNPRNFKAHVSPHEMLQAVVLWSRKKFQFTEQGDPVEFLSWFLNALHLALNGTKKPESSIVYRAFLGHMRIYTRKIPPIELEDQQKEALLRMDEYQETMTESPFLYLTCDLPPPPLFKDEFRENIIPQVNLYTLLQKFNGQMEKEYKTYKENFMKRFEIVKLPPYLILYVKRWPAGRAARQNNLVATDRQLSSPDDLGPSNRCKPGHTAEDLGARPATCARQCILCQPQHTSDEYRFTKNTFFTEKNPTIVNFPVKNVDFGDILTQRIKEQHKNTMYDLVANIVHDGEPMKGTYRVHVLHK